jgi:hypothetical protein
MQFYFAMRRNVPRVHVAGGLFNTVTDLDIAVMGLRKALRWAADADGRLLTRKLARVAEVRRYKPGWVFHNSGKHWETVWNEMERWRRGREKEKSML